MCCRYTDIPVVYCQVRWCSCSMSGTLMSLQHVVRYTGYTGRVLSGMTMSLYNVVHEKMNSVLLKHVCSCCCTFGSLDTVQSVAPWRRRLFQTCNPMQDTTTNVGAQLQEFLSQIHDTNDSVYYSEPLSTWVNFSSHLTSNGSEGHNKRDEHWGRCTHQHMAHGLDPFGLNKSGCLYKHDCTYYK